MIRWTFHYQREMKEDPPCAYIDVAEGEEDENVEEAITQACIHGQDLVKVHPKLWITLHRLWAITHSPVVEEAVQEAQTA